MDLIKTGKFIQERRKTKKLTQMQLAEKLLVSEKTISKWECGNGFPDTSLMLPLCEALEITANELLSGKLLSNEEYKAKAEENLLELKERQEKNVKHLFNAEILMICLSMVLLLGAVTVASYVEMPTVFRVLLIVFGFINIVITIVFSIIIETKVGFYECKNCHHKYVPTYSQMVWSMHMGRTRFMKCPKCGKRSWNKKVISED